MQNFIIAAIVIVVLVFAVRASLKHFRGEGGCCGGGTYKARPKKLTHTAEVKTFRVEGMHCQNCANRVMDAVNSIDGVSGVVHLKKGLVKVEIAYCQGKTHGDQRETLRRRQSDLEMRRAVKR